MSVYNITKNVIENNYKLDRFLEMVIGNIVPLKCGRKYDHN